MSPKIDYIDCEQEKKEKVNIFVAQPQWNQEDWEAQKDLFFPKNSQKQIDYINAFLQKSLDMNSDIVIFPELSILRDHLVLIEKWAKEHNQIIIAGSHYKIDEEDGLKANIAAIYINGEYYEHTKTIPASLEKSVLADEELKCGNSINKYKNTICGTLCVTICAEYLDKDTNYTILQNDDIDVLIVIALHKGSEERYFNRMNINTEDSDNGIYILYANNLIDNISDGSSSIFGLVDNSFTRTSSYSEPLQVYKLDDKENYFLAELDIKNKKSSKRKNTGSKPPIANIEGDFIEVYPSYEIENIDYITICEEDFDSNTFYASHTDWKGKTYELIYSLHQNIEHDILQLEQEIKNTLQLEQIAQKGGKKKPSRELIHKRIEDTITNVLVEIKTLIDLFAGDISVHIKLVERDLENGTVINYLRTLYREPSEKEKKRVKDKKIVKRDEGAKEIFKIFEHNNISVMKNYKMESDNLRINSAYNTILLNPSKSWLCNNLLVARDKELYFSNSENWEKYYESLVLFPITDKYSDTVESDSLDLNLKGLLIFDSKKPKCFESELIKQIGGFVSHRLNYLFSIDIVKEKYFAK